MLGFPTTGLCHPETSRGQSSGKRRHVSSPAPERGAWRASSLGGRHRRGGPALGWPGSFCPLRVSSVSAQCPRSPPTPWFPTRNDIHCKSVRDMSYKEKPPVALAGVAPLVGASSRARKGGGCDRGSALSSAHARWNGLAIRRCQRCSATSDPIPSNEHSHRFSVSLSSKALLG